MLIIAQLCFYAWPYSTWVKVSTLVSGVCRINEIRVAAWGWCTIDVDRQLTNEQTILGGFIRSVHVSIVLELFWLRNAKVTANLDGQVVADFVVPWNGASPVCA